MFDTRERPSSKNLENYNEQDFEKNAKSPFLSILGQNLQFWTVFGQNEQNGIFLKKYLENFLSGYKY